MSNSRKTQFIELFKKFGFILNDSEETFNLLNVDQRIFQSNLNEFIKKSSDNPSREKNLSNLKSFIESYLEDEMNFFISLLPTKNNNDLVSSHSSNQDNLLKLLLELKELQSDLFEILITKIMNYTETSETNGDVQVMNLNINVPCYIINQFRYQPKINEPELLCKKLMELVNSISATSIKKELILCFPDILSDCQHDELIAELEEMLSETDLVSVTLDTLSNLKFKNDNIKKISNKLFTTYGVLNESDLPAVVKFILKSASSLNSKEIFNGLREKVKFDEISNETNRYLLFDILREYFLISNQLIDLFMSIMTQSLTEAENGTLLIEPIDFVIISLVYSIPQHFKQIDKLFKQILKQELSKKNIEKSIEIVLKHSKSFINELFDPICIVAKSLIQSSNNCVFSIAQSIYKISFHTLDKKFKLDLINILVEHITCSSGPSRDNSLDILADLCSKANPNPLSPFSMQIKTLLDYIEYFSLTQIRKVYFVICSVAYSISKPISQPSASISAISCSLANRSSSIDTSLITTNSIQDNLHILINKQLSSNSLKYKQIGVIGALMMIKNMASKSPQPSNNQDSQNSSESEDFFSCSSTPSGSGAQNLPINSTVIQNSSMILSNVSNEVKSIWQMILDSSKSSPESLGLFEDDLTSILLKESMNESLEILIKENLKEMTKNLFKLDINYRASLAKFESQLCSFKFGYEFGIDDHAVGALNLLPLVMNDMQKKNSLLLESSALTNSPIPSIAIPSTFRLMCVLERKNINELKEYLGVPILTISKDELYKYGNYGTDSDLISTGTSLFTKFKHSLDEDEKRVICNSIFYIINWFIELINAFSPKLSEANDFKLKLVDRLTRVCELQQVLANLLPHMKFYRPPMAVFGLVDSSPDELPYVHQLIKVKEAGKGKGKGSLKRKGKGTKKKIVKKVKKEDLFANSEMEDEKEIVGDTDDEIENSVLDDNDKENNYDSNVSSEVDLNKLSMYFREFDLSLINFVNLDLELNPNIIPDSSDNQNLDSKLKPDTLIYILTDFNRKLLLILKSTVVTSFGSKLASLSAKPNKIQQFLQLNPIEPKQLIQNLINSNLDSLFNHLDSICKHIKDIQNKNDGIKDPAEICNQKHNIVLLKSLSQILKIITQIFKWLSSNDEQKMIEKIFRKLASKAGSSHSTQIQIEKVPELLCFNYIARLKDVILDLSTAFDLVQLLDLLANKMIAKKSDSAQSNLQKCRIILCKTSEEFLLNDYNVKLNALFSTRQSSNESILNLLNTYIRNLDDPLQVVEILVKIITSEEYMEDRQNCEKFNTLKHHFLSYYKVLLEFSHNELKFVEKHQFKDIDSNENLIVEIFSKIRTLVHIHSSLVDMKKNKIFKDINILSVIKNSRLFLNNFLKYSMPWLDQAFENHKEEVVQILQQIQKSVHYIQEICVTKDQSAIAKQAPIYMRCVEALMVRVRQLLYVNHCDNAFSVNLFDNKLKIGAKSTTGRQRPEKKAAVKGGKRGVKKGKSAEPEPEPEESEIESEKEEEEESEIEEDE